MTWGMVAVAGASLAGGLIASSGAQSAAGTQAASYDRAAALQKEQFDEQKRLLKYRQQLWEHIKELPGIHLNGHEHQRIAGNLNISFTGLNGDSLLYALHELALSTSSACTSASIQPSYVLKELGLSDDLAQSSIRLSLGRFTQEEDIDKAINIICSQVVRLRTMASE